MILVCRASEVPEGRLFVTRLTRLEGIVLERNPSFVAVALSAPDADVSFERKLHPNVLVEVSRAEVGR